jgi:hypothetical protein
MAFLELEAENTTTWETVINAKTAAGGIRRPGLRVVNSGVQGIAIDAVSQGVGQGNDHSAGVVGTGRGADSDGVVGITLAGSSNLASRNVAGVVGIANAGPGQAGDGVQGVSHGDFRAGVAGSGFGYDSRGVMGFAHYGSQAIGIRGSSQSGWAGWFRRNVRVIGVLVKAGSAFAIDHPLDPENKYLNHSAVESPDMLNIYNGNVTTDSEGTATVELPSYFKDVNRDYCYQLTVMGKFAQAIVAEEIRGNQFRIATDSPGVKVFWQVTGVRNDPWAERNRIVVEQNKPEEERGTYLHPELYGKPETQGAGYVREDYPTEMPAEPPLPA